MSTDTSTNDMMAGHYRTLVQVLIIMAVGSAAGIITGVLLAVMG